MTFRILFSLIFLFVVAAVAITIIGSQTLIDRYEDSGHTDLVEQTFAALEAGPLALARLHASDIAQEHLERLVQQINANSNTIQEIKISSVGADGYTYASWKNPSLADVNCRVIKTKPYKFPNAISDYKIDLVSDKCAFSNNLRKVIKQVKITFYVISFCLFLGLIVLFLPLLLSLQRANKIILHGGNVDEIPFVPVRNIVSKAIKVRDLEINAKKFELAKQVAHDIRSPLSALEILYSSLNKNEKHTELLLSASSRIKSIANSLLLIDKNSYNFTNEYLTVSVLRTEIQRIFEETKAISPNIKFVLEISPELDQTIKCIFERNWVGRIVSNLVNNSIESISSEGCVKIFLYHEKDFVNLSVTDDGSGMSDDLISKVLTTSFSTKPNGFGLGIQSASKKMTEWGGKFDIDSSTTNGTKVTLSFRKV